MCCQTWVQDEYKTESGTVIAADFYHSNTLMPLSDEEIVTKVKANLVQCEPSFRTAKVHFTGACVHTYTHSILCSHACLNCGCILRCPLGPSMVGVLVIKGLHTDTSHAVVGVWTGSSHHISLGWAASNSEYGHCKAAILCLCSAAAVATDCCRGMTAWVETKDCGTACIVARHLVMTHGYLPSKYATCSSCLQYYVGLQVVDSAVLRFPNAVTHFSPGSYTSRPLQRTSFGNVFMAGDWVKGLNHGANGLSQERAYITGLTAANLVIGGLSHGVPAVIIPVEEDEKHVSAAKGANQAVQGFLEALPLPFGRL